MITVGCVSWQALPVYTSLAAASDRVKLKQTYWNSGLMALGGLGAGWQFFKDVRIGLILAAVAFVSYLFCALWYWKKRCLKITGTSNLRELEWFYSRSPDYHIMSLDKLREAYIEEKGKRRK